MDFPEARAHVVALLLKCPYETNPTNCYLHDLRGESMKENIEVTKRMTEEQVQHIITMHEKCLSQKEGKRSLKD